MNYVVTVYTCQEKGELKDEGLNSCVVCTLFALLVRGLCAGRKRNVCASALPWGMLSVGSAGVGILGADCRILSGHVKILNADCSFLGADGYFLFADSNFLNQFIGFLRSVVKSLKAKGSFVFADWNSPADVGYFLKEEASLLLWGGVWTPICWLVWTVGLWLGYIFGVPGFWYRCHRELFCVR